MSARFILNETSYHGAGAINEIATEAKGRAFKKAFVCSDPDLIKFNVTKKVLDVLEKAGLDYEVYSDIKPNPTIENVQGGVAAFKKSGADYIIAIGGGSSMDTAKAIGIIIKNPEFEDVRSLEGVADTKNKCVPIFAVPTTAGTAAEVTINYVITDAEKNRKMVCVDPHDIPVVAFIDPDMMSTMPKSLTAATGMDALTHAIEGYITKGEEDSIKCCYEQKLQKYAVLLELLPLGFGHYYSGRIINFGIKLTFQLIIILYMFIFSCCCKSFNKRKKYKGYDLLNNDSNKNDFIYNNNLKAQIDSAKMVTNAIYICSFIIMIIWQGLDIFLFGLNVYTDANSVELKRW